MDAAELNLDQYLERVVGIERSDRSSHLARAAILEQATILDYALNELIAARRQPGGRERARVRRLRPHR